FQPSDLGLNSFTTASPAASSSKDVTAVVVNNDGGDANLFEVNYYLSDDPTITTSDTLLKSTIVQHMAGSSTMTLGEHLDLPAPLMSDNQYYVGVLLDPDGRVFENGNDFNNSASS